MPTSKKVSIRVLFGIGFICILFAGIRVAQVAINTARPKADGQTLDPRLAIWGMVECSIGTSNFYTHIHYNTRSPLAVIIGCCPAFAILVNAFRSKTPDDSRGYRKHGESNSNSKGGSKIELQTIGSGGGRRQGVGLDTIDSYWAGAHSSQEELRTKHEGILVSTVTHVRDSADVADVAEVFGKR